MDDASRSALLPDDIDQLKAIIAQHQAMIATLTRQRDEFHLKSLQLEVRLAKALRQVYGPRADRIPDQAQLVLDFAKQLEDQPIDPADLPPAAASDRPVEVDRKPSRRLRTSGRRDIGSMNHLPMIEKTYELIGDLCLCPVCRSQREKIGSEISYTIERIPASFLRIKNIQCKYACRSCEQNAENPNIELAQKQNASPIDKGMAGPGLLAYAVEQPTQMPIDGMDEPHFVPLRAKPCRRMPQRNGVKIPRGPEMPCSGCHCAEHPFTFQTASLICIGRVSPGSVAPNSGTTTGGTTVSHHFVIPAQFGMILSLF